MAAGPPDTESRRLARVVLVFGCLNGVGIYLVTPLAAPDQLMLASDVYAHAAGQLLAGDPIYHVHPPDRSGYTYLYPPIVTLLFVPHALVGLGVGAFALQTALNLLAAVAIGVVLARLLARRGVAIESVDRFLLVAFFILSSYSAIQFINGQVNLWIALAIAVGFDAMDRQHEHIAGAAFSGAALLKVFPAIMGLWLLRLRAWRAVATAILVGIGGLLLGLAVFGVELTTTYVVDVLLARFEGSTYDGRPDPTDSVDGIHRQLAAIWPTGSRFHTAIGVVILGTLLAGAYRRVNTSRERDIAGLATLLAILLFLPLQPLYFPLIAVPLILLLYRLAPGWERWAVGTGAVLTMIHVDRESAELLATTSQLPGGVTEPVLTLLSTVFQFVLPPTLGMWILLVVCVGMQRSATDSQVGV